MSRACLDGGLAMLVDEPMVTPNIFLPRIGKVEDNGIAGNAGQH